MQPIFKTTLKKRKKTKLFISTYVLYEQDSWSVFVSVEGETVRHEYDFEGLIIPLGKMTYNEAFNEAEIIHHHTVDLNKRLPVLEHYLDYMDSDSLEVQEPFLEGDILNNLLEDTNFGRN